MNALSYALNTLRFKIPIEVLNIGILEDYQNMNTAISLDEMLLNKVIRKRVLVDANIVGGRQINIPLSSCKVTRYSDSYYVVNVDKKHTMNSVIISALSLVTGGDTRGSTLKMHTDNSDQGKMFNNMDKINVHQTARLELVGDNTVVVHGNLVDIASTSMRVTIENASNLENISPRNMIVFGELVTQAVKSYIYINSIVRLDKGFIYGGHELSSIKDIIDGYADAEELYLEILQSKWKKIAFMNNTEAMHRHVVSMIGNMV